MRPANGFYWKQGKSEGLDSCQRPTIVAQIWSKSSILQHEWHQKLIDDIENNRAPLLHYIKLCASFQSHRWIQTEVPARKRPIRVKIGDFFVKLYASFHHHMWNQTGVTVRKRLSWILTCVTLTFNLWLTLTFRIDFPSVIGNNFWKFHDDTMMGT